MSFIQAYLEHTKDYESPTSFWKWSAYSAVSAVLRDNCYRRRGDSFLFPSIYVLFMAGSGGRKGPPVELAQTLVVKVKNTKVISGRSSIQAILDELAHTETDRKTGHIIKGGSAIFFAPELSAGIVTDQAALDIFCDIYDYKRDDYTSRLRHSNTPKFKIERLVFSMLVASNEPMIKALYTQTAIEGGLLARTFLIIPNEFRPPNSLMQYVDRTASFENLVKKLNEISGLKGEFIYEDSAITEYESWYNPFRLEQQRRLDRTGVLGRIQTGILKLAMIFAADELTLNVCKRHIERAIFECLAILPNYNTFAMTSGKSNIKEAAAVVLEELQIAKDNEVTQKELLFKHYSKFDLELLEKTAMTLEAGGAIIRMIQGTIIKFKLTEKYKEILKKGI